MVFSIVLGNFKSLCRFLFVTYQGADVIRRRHIDWNVCSVLVLKGFADPMVAEYHRVYWTDSFFVYCHFI